MADIRLPDQSYVRELSLRRDGKVLEIRAVGSACGE